MVIEKNRVINEIYEIREPIGEGGAGQVFLAWHRNLQKKVVLKKIKEKYVGRINERGEADILKKLHHRYLPQVYDFIQIEDEVYTVIDYIDGNTLAEYIERGVRFDEPQIIKWLKQLCEALEYLHSQNPPIIHSDIKPANIMVDIEGNICLIDFNISFDETDMKKISGYTAGYASPEQERKVKLYTSGGRYLDVHLDARSDIFSLGASIYHIMTLQNPIKVMSEGTDLWDVSVDMPYSELLLSIVEKALKRDPEKRYQTAGEMLRALETMKIRDKRYRKLVISQTVYCSVFMVLLVTGFFLTLKGTTVRNTEAFEAEYGAVVETAESDEYDKTIADAISILNNDKYIRILDERDEEKADLLYIIANAYFENDEYESAIPFYEEAVNTSGNNPGYYRDYAIAYARTGKTDRAGAILEEGIGKGLSGADLYLVNAEIESTNGNVTQAMDDFKKAIDSSSDSNITGRAYLLYARAALKKGDLRGARIILEEAYGVVDDRWRLRVLRELGAVAIRYLEENGEDTDWIETAESCYGTLVKSERYTLNDWLNYSLLLKMKGNNSEAMVVLTDTRNRYPDEYRVPLRQAMMEIEAQYEKDEDDRNYRKAEEYYHEAEKLYEKYRNSGNSDEEMQNLESIVQELKEKGWLS